MTARIMLCTTGSNLAVYPSKTFPHTKDFQKVLQAGRTCFCSRWFAVGWACAKILRKVLIDTTKKLEMKAEGGNGLKVSSLDLGFL